ncbi:MAG: ATP-binding protein, partial [bacterium]|nr:ATP-binding protein [bacterium]
MHPFVDRQEAIEQFQTLIDFEHPTEKPFLQFYGMGGIGKSFLINHLKTTYLKDIPTVHIVFEPGGSDYSYDSLLRQILRALRPKLADTTPFRTFKATRDQCLHESNQQISKIENTIMASGGSTIEIGTNIQSVALEKLRADVRQRITEEFLDTMPEIEPCPLLIILDAVENLLPEVQSEKETPDYAGWLLNFLLEFCQCFPTLRVLLAGRHELTYDSLKLKCREVKLFHLPEGKVTEYLEQLGISDNMLIEAIFRLTEGYSLSVSMIGDLWQDSEGNLRAEDLDTEEFHAAYRNKMVPELLMRRIMERADDRLKLVIERAGIFRYFTYQILKDTLFPELQKDDFQRLTKYTFINKTGKHYQYHAVLRQIITESFLEQDPGNFRRDCAIIYHYFAEQKSDERFFYGIYGQIEGVFEEWENTRRRYDNTWQTDQLKNLIDMINEIQQPFPEQEQALIWLAKGRYAERLYQWDKALNYYQKSEQTQVRGVNQAGLGLTYSYIGFIYFWKGEYEQALTYYQKSAQIQIEMGDQKGLGRTYHWIGWTYSNKGELEQALDYYQKSKQIGIEVGNQIALGWTYYHIGSIYYRKGELEQALDYYWKSEQSCLETDNQAALGFTYKLIGGIYSTKNDYNQALTYYRKSEQIHLKIGHHMGLGWTYCSIGQLYFRKGEWDEALAYYQKSVQLHLKVGNQRGLGWAYHDIGCIYDRKGEWEQALDYYQKSAQLYLEIDNQEDLGQIYYNVGKLYHSKGKQEQALDFYRKSEQIRLKLGDQANLGGIYYN